jgi:hypothetical protein
MSTIHRQQLRARRRIVRALRWRSKASPDQRITPSKVHAAPRSLSSITAQRHRRCNRGAPS